MMQIQPNPDPQPWIYGAWSSRKIECVGLKLTVLWTSSSRILNILGYEDLDPEQSFRILNESEQISSKPKEKGAKHGIIQLFKTVHTTQGKWYTILQK